MKDASTTGVDLAKQFFQLLGATVEGEIVFRKKPSRKQFLAFMHTRPRCKVTMEACATAHHGARILTDCSGDTLGVTKLDRLAQSVAHLVEILPRSHDKGAVHRRPRTPAARRSDRFASGAARGP
jgi:hypothetical protein